MIPGAVASRGWHVFDADMALEPWCAAAAQATDRVVADPDMRARWLQCEGTWFVGVDALPTDPGGALDGISLQGAAIDALRPLPALHPAQVSVVWPGYPRPRAGESEAAFRYRQRRDAAHVDGVRAEGADRRRYLREPHAWILGIPLGDAAPGASPLVVWEGSHAIIGQALRDALKGIPTDDWHRTDITETYTAARRVVFDTCRRVALPTRAGAAVLLHRLCLHGIAPWTATQAEARAIAYFRPPMEGGVPAWLGTG